MTRWGMAIDLKRCIGCYSCVIVCKQDHFLPPGIFWNRVLVNETGDYPNVLKNVFPVLCNHCKDPACNRACPSGANRKRQDGIVHIDRRVCAGCGYCVIACPYQQVTLHEGKKNGYFGAQGPTALEIIGSKLYPLEKGTAVKCNFCMEKIDEGMKKGLASPASTARPRRVA